MLETQQNVITIIVVCLFIINVDWFSLGYFFILSFNKLKSWLRRWIILRINKGLLLLKKQVRDLTQGMQQLII